MVLQEARAETGEETNRKSVTKLGFEPRQSQVTALTSCYSSRVLHAAPAILDTMFCMITVLSVSLSLIRARKRASQKRTEGSRQQIFVTILSLVPTISSDGAAY